MTLRGDRIDDERRDILSAIPVYVWSALPDGTVDFVNPQWEKFTGLPASAALGWRWQSVIHPDDADRYISAWLSALQDFEPLEQEIRVRRNDGNYRWWLIRCTPAFNPGGEALKWYGSGFDIDDRKRAQEELRRQDARIEQELRNTIDAIPVLCSTLSSDGNVEFFNQRTLEYYGLKADQMSCFSWKSVVHAQDLPRLESALSVAMPSGRPIELETRNRRADGEYRWLLHRIVPRYDEGGIIVKWYGTSVDIEDRKRAEEAVLEQRVFERTRIARELHDTLLQSFQGTLLMLGAAKNLLNAGPVKEQLEHALEEADRAMSEGREAIQGLRLGKEEPRDFIAALNTFGQGLAAVRGADEALAFHVEISGELTSVHASVGREVFSIGCEALRNAFRHACAKHIHVQFRYDPEEFVVAVIDDGTGIERTLLARGPGEGHFGLSGMHERATIVGGKLNLWSELGIGTRVELKIPAMQAYAIS